MAGPEQPGGRIDVGVVTELAAGRPGPATRQLQTSDPAGNDDPVARLVEAEWAARCGERSIGHLVELAEDVATRYPEAPLWHWWAIAAVGERCATAFDLDGMGMAAGVLDTLPRSALGSLPFLWVRGRLRRLAGLRSLFATPPDVRSHENLQSAAISDFVRCDLVAEIALTRALGAAMRGLWLWKDQQANLAVVQDARHILGERTESRALPLVDGLAVVLALAVGDRPAAEEAMTWLASTAPRARGYGAHVDAILALGRLVHGPGDPDATKAVVEAVDVLRAADPSVAHAMARFAAAALANVEESAAARTVGGPVLDMQISHAVDGLDRDLFAVRLDLIAGRPRSARELIRRLDDISERGHPARAAGHAHRLERDLTRLGDPEGASALRAWTPPAVQAGVDATPGPDERDPDERSARGSGDRAGTGARGRTSLRVLSPDVRVTVGDQPVHLRPQPARLLLAMVVSHPRPLHAEEAADHLWPNVPWPVARRRLNVVTHRLRQALGDHRATVVRRGNALVLAADNWDVDLFQVRGADPTSPEDTTPEDATHLAQTLRAVTGNLAHAQFPYDERLGYERRFVAVHVEKILSDHEWGRHLAADAPSICRALGIPTTSHADGDM